MNKSYNIFSQPWWLDAVAPNSWNEVTVERGGQVVARLPFVTKKRYGLTLLMMPKLTQNFMLWLNPAAEKYSNRLSEEKELITEIIDKLPRYDIFSQNFHYSLTNWLPFYWKGYQQTTFYTYILQDLSNLDLVWDEFRKNIKTDIRKAQKQLIVKNDLGINSFLDLVEKTFTRQGMSIPYSRELVTRLDIGCCEHSCRKIFYAEDAQGKIHAAVYIVWDENSAYYLMGGGDPDLRNSGATSLCMWEAIQFASTVTKSFDFEGSMVESIERFFRAFGAKQIPYFRISRFNSLPLKVLQEIRLYKKTQPDGR